MQTRIRIFSRDSTVEIAIGNETGASNPEHGKLVHVITAWNPRGARVTPSANDERQRDFEEQLNQLTHRWVPAAGVADNGLWAEASAAITGLTREQAVHIGRRWDQEAIFEWDPVASVVAVVSCVDDRLTVRTALVHQMLSRPCPMRPPGERSQEACIRPGGGWTSLSMEVAAEFEMRRQTMLRAVGCDICNGSPASGTSGRPVPLAQAYEPCRADSSRFTHPK